MPIKKEELIHIDARGVRLEARMTPAKGSGAAIITHPHPLYGGDMDNPVVVAISKAYAERKWGVLRFNFRGTGDSQGRFDNGGGEQDDVQAAIDRLRRDGFRTIELAGYSFGAWVLAHWAQKDTAHGHRIRFIAPPVAFMDFDGIDRIAGLEQIIVGGRDDIAPPRQVAAKLKTWAPEADLQIIERADHFFGYHLNQLRTALVQKIAKMEPLAEDPPQEATAR